MELKMSYPVCNKCGKGVLLPFFYKDIANVYFCSHCGVRFMGLRHEPLDENGKPIFLLKAEYISTGVAEIREDRSVDDELDEVFEIVVDDESGVSEVEVSGAEKGYINGSEAEMETGIDVMKPVTQADMEITAAEDKGQIVQEETIRGDAETLKKSSKPEKKKKRKTSEDGKEDTDDVTVPEDLEAYEKILAKYIEEE